MSVYIEARERITITPTVRPVVQIEAHGPPGIQGPPGPQGIPGELTADDLPDLTLIFLNQLI